MRKKKASKYRSYTFRCEIGLHDDVIALLEKSEDNERSEDIRMLLRLGARLPMPPRPQIVDLETLRAELVKAADYILDSLPMLSPEQTTDPLIDSLRDVNDKGRNIPNF